MIHRTCTAGAAGMICRKPAVRFYIWRPVVDAPEILFGRCIIHILFPERPDVKILTTEEVEVAEVMLI